MSTQDPLSRYDSLGITADQADKVIGAVNSLMLQIVDATSTKDGKLDLSLAMIWLGIFLADRMVALDHELTVMQGPEERFHTELLTGLVAGYRHRLNVEMIAASQVEALLKAELTRQ
jgi:hypothetical protein